MKYLQRKWNKPNGKRHIQQTKTNPFLPLGDFFSSIDTSGKKSRYNAAKRYDENIANER
jgi:hypothetical protein